MRSSKDNSKPKNTSKGIKPVENKKIAENKTTHTDEEIRQKANELYFQRIERGEHGSAEQDWINAAKALEESED